MAVRLAPRNFKLLVTISGRGLSDGRVSTGRIGQRDGAGEGGRRIKREGSGSRDGRGVGAAENRGRRDANGVGAAEREGRGVSGSVSHRGASSGHVLSAGLQHFASSQIGVIVSQRANSGLQHGPRDGMKELSGRIVGTTVASEPPQTGASGGHTLSAGLQQVAVGHTLRKSGPQDSFSGLQQGPLVGALVLPHKGNPIGHTFRVGLQQLAVVQIFVKSSQRCLAGSQQMLSVGGGKGVKSDGGGEGAEASHVGNPVGHVFKRVLQQLTPGQRRLKSEQVCFEGSQHAGADVIVGVPQIGTPEGHFVRVGLQQNTEGS